MLSEKNLDIQKIKYYMIASTEYKSGKIILI